MVSSQENPPSSQCYNSNHRFNNISSNSSSKSQSWLMGRSMRTVRSNLFPSPSIPSSSSSSSIVNINNNNNNNNNNNYQYSSFDFLTDSVIIDLRLHELAAHKSDLHLNNNNNNIDAGSQSDNNSQSSSFLFKLLQLDDHSLAFSASSSCSDISGELRRLAATTTNDDPTHHHHDHDDHEEDEPCPAFLDRDSFSTDIIDTISPDDLLPTVKLCVHSLSSPSTSIRRSAAAKLRLLAKNRPDNRALIGECTGAVPSLIHLLRSTDPRTQEHSVTALLNLSLHDRNRDLMSDPVAVKSLIYVLKTGTETSKQNAACALLNLSLTDEGTRMTIGACGAIPPLVSLLINGSTRGKKDALTTLYKLCSGGRVNKERAVSAGAVGPLVGMMMAEQQCEGLMEKAMVVLSSLAGIGEGREAIVEEGGIAVLVEAIDHDEEVSRSHKVKEFAVMTLLQLCVGDDESVRRNRGLLIREGGIPPLAALSQSGTLKAKHKAETLLRYLREPRQEASTSANP